MDLSILIPVKNCAALTDACLTALGRTLPPGLASETLVYDDRSTDETPEVLRRHGVRVITGETPGAFASNMNALAREARGRWLVHLNNDTVPQPGWIEPLLERAESEPRPGVVGNLHLFPRVGAKPRAINHAGVVFDDRRIGRHLYQGLPEDTQPARGARQLQAVCAACCLTPADAFRHLGGYDEAYRNGHEDLDLCLRAREAGMTVWYEGRSAIVHLGSSTPGRFDHSDANHARFHGRWADRIVPDQAAVTRADAVHWPDYPVPYRLARGVSRQPALRGVIRVAVQTPVGARLRQEFVTRFSAHA